MRRPHEIFRDKDIVLHDVDEDVVARAWFLYYRVERSIRPMSSAGSALAATVIVGDLWILSFFLPDGYGKSMCIAALLIGLGLAVSNSRRATTLARRERDYANHMRVTIAKHQRN